MAGTIRSRNKTLKENAYFQTISMCVSQELPGLSDMEQESLAVGLLLNIGRQYGGMLILLPMLGNLKVAFRKVRFGWDFSDVGIAPKGLENAAELGELLQKTLACERPELTEERTLRISRELLLRLSIIDRKCRYMPKFEWLKRSQRNQKIIADWQAKFKIKEIAWRHDLSEMQVYSIIKQFRSADRIDS